MNILVVEDDSVIADGLKYALETEGYSVIHAASCTDAMEVLSEIEFGLTILDVGLPDGNGFDICKTIKAERNTPVIFLTAVDDECNTVRGFDMGADDFIVKPFRLRELLARIRAVLRRHDGLPQQLIFQNVQIHPNSAKVFQDGKEIELTALEYRLLLNLASHKGQTLTRSQILDSLWDVAGNFVNDNTLTVYIKRLREKLGDDSANPRLIQTVRGIGYRAGE